MRNNNIESNNDSKKLEDNIENLTKKVEKLENKNAVLTNQIESFSDPNENPRIIRKGFVNTSVKFQKNKEIVKPVIN